MLIKIIRGTYGLKSGNIIKPKTCSDPPFHVEHEEGERLIRLGIADLVFSDTMPPVRNKGDDPNAVPDSKVRVLDSDDDEGYEVKSTVEERDVPEYSEDNTNAELQAIAKEYGIEFPQRANKAQMLDALDEFFGGTPEISAREPE